MSNDERTYTAPDVGIPGPSKQREMTEEPKPAGNSAPVVDPHASTLVKTLESLNQRITSDSQAARLMSDPNIAAYLQARENGTKVKIIPEEQAQPAPAPAPTVDPNVDYETMTNAQMISHLQKTMLQGLRATAQEIVSGEITKLRSEITPVLTDVASSTNAQRAEAIQASIKAVREKYKDFDQMKPAMVEINKTVQGLNPEELYLLAKVRSGLPIVSQTQIETEKPQQAPQGRQFSRPKNTLGRAGFDALLDAALKD